MNPLITVIIPVYNVGQYLEEAIKSISEQTYKNLEIILVNDGSTDNSDKICDNFALIDKRIKVIHKKNGGLSSARNAGLNIATGDYIYFLDGDDFIETDSIELLLYGFNKNSNIGIVSAPCFYRYNNKNIEIYRKDWFLEKENVIAPDDFCIKTLKQEACHSACSKLYKKNLFDNIRFREGKKNEDTLFMFDLSKNMIRYKYYMLEITKKSYYYRETPGSICRNSTCPIQIDIIENLQSLMNETNDYKTIKTIKKIFYNELLSFYSILLKDKTTKSKINNNDYNRFNNIFMNINVFDILNYSSIRNVIRYITFRHIPTLYIFFKQEK